MRYDKRGRKKITLLRNFGKWGHWNRICKKLIIPITPAPRIKIEKIKDKSKIIIIYKKINSRNI